MNKRLKQFTEAYHGSSFPTKCETTDGATCVIKMRGAGNGSSALLSEFVVNRLMSKAGLPVPDVFIVNIADGCPWEFGTDEFYDLVRKSVGPNLALTWLGGVTPVHGACYSTLADEVVSQVVTIDLAFANFDRSAPSANLVTDPSGHCWIIDHGSCRFLYEPAFLPSKRLPKNHVFADRADTFDPRWLQPISPTLISETTAEIPDLWLAETLFTREDVAHRIARCLEFKK